MLLLSSKLTWGLEWTSSRWCPSRGITGHPESGPHVLVDNKTRIPLRFNFNCIWLDNYRASFGWALAGWTRPILFIFFSPVCFFVTYFIVSFFCFFFLLLTLKPESWDLLEMGQVISFIERRNGQGKGQSEVFEISTCRNRY